MKSRLVRYFISTILVFFGLSTPSISGSEEPSQDNNKRVLSILRQVDDMWRGKSSYAVLTMKVKTAHYTRSLQLEAWSKGKDKTLVRIIKPLKEKGTATLKSGNHIYSYLPKTDRTIRLTSGMMMGSWMGSHFTNDDLVKESRMEEDYYASISFEGVRNGRKIIEFTLIPKPEAAVVWGKVVMTVVANNLIPIEQIYFDEDMLVARTMTFSHVKNLSGKLRPSVMRIVPADKPDEYTELVYSKLVLDISLKDEFFSLLKLKQR
ncbi:MAG: outer membrane lipoprotein-sorting protein [Gammaproteobacteria bacterium]|nr:MAG: outer membrane lipoprotein-sorting protein [Gammaproteobacteria bacterium]